MAVLSSSRGLFRPLGAAVHFVVLLAFFHSGVSRAELPIPLANQAYDEGRWDEYPVQQFKSVELIAPRPNLLRQDGKCLNNFLTFLTPHGSAGDATHPQATILDQDGHLIWTSGWDNKKIYNLMAQEYKGHQYITFWAGNDAVDGHGSGSYYMLDQSYNMTRRVHAANGLTGDLHDFRITPQGTALITAYAVQDHDLGMLGKGVGPIWDCVFQEVDIETGDLVFEWRASQHIRIEDTYRVIGHEGESGGAPFDWFHITSVDKDASGNYLVSSKYMNSLYYIDGRTSSVIWTLGGKANKFRDLSGGKATDFAFQYDARWDNDYSEITLFNIGSDGRSAAKSQPRGMRLAVNQVLMTVELVTEYKNALHVPVKSQGSMQNLPNGNVLVGYGHSGLFTEFSRSGKVLCDTHFAPQSGFGSGGVQSQRVLKFDWHSDPQTAPDLVVAQDEGKLWRAYASWNGATEVAGWVLQGTDDEAKGRWKAVEHKEKSGFETDFVLRADHPAHVRVVALDSRGNALATSLPVDATKAWVIYILDTPQRHQFTAENWNRLTAAMTGFALVFLVICLRPVIRTCLSFLMCGGGRRSVQHHPALLPTEEDKSYARGHQVLTQL